MRIRSLLALLLVLSLGSGGVLAQLDGLGDQVRGLPTRVMAQGPLYGFRDGDLWVGVYLGGVEVVQGDLRLRGRTAVVTVAFPEGDGDDDALEADDGGAMLIPYTWLKEVYVEGDVSLEQGLERIAGAGTAYVDNRTGTVHITDGEMRTDFPEGPLVVRFDRMRRLIDGTAELEGVSYSTCEYEHQHWHLEAGRASLTPADNGRIFRASNVTARISDVPVFWWPGLATNLDATRPPLRRVETGKSSRFGTEIRTWWGGDVSEPTRTIADALGYEGRKLDVDFEMQVSFLSDRGMFWEPAFRYETDHSKGKIFGSYIKDSANTDALDVPVTDSTRGRIDVQHRTKIDEHQTVDIEVSRLSDSNFLNEYYENEFREGKEQETYINYRNVVDNKALQFLFRPRLNDFQTQVEYLPRLEHRVVGEAFESPLLDGVYSARSFIDSARLRPDEEDPTASRSPRNTRAGTTVNVEVPFDPSDGDRVVAGLANSVTYFEEGADGHHKLRWAMGGQVGWTRTYSGVDPEAESDTWNIDGLRRIVEPQIGYRNLFSISETPSDLIPIDEEESLRRFQVVTVGIRDRIQTHQDGKVVTLWDAQVEIPFYPNEDRDNPDQFEGGEGETAGLLRWDLRWKPGADIPLLRHSTTRWRGKYNPNDNGYTESYFSYATQIDPDRTFLIADNKTRGNSHFLTVATQWVLTPKWAAALFFQQDFREHEVDSAGLIFRQTAHRWLIDLELGYRRGESSTGNTENEGQVRVRFTPAILKGGQTLLDEISSRVR